MYFEGQELKENNNVVVMINLEQLGMVLPSTVEKILLLKPKERKEDQE